jgi:hypothetical protein
MKIADIITELRKKKVSEPKAGDETAHDWDPGWQELNWFREQALDDGNRLASRGYQLFIPRVNRSAMTKQDRRHVNLTNPYAYDDQGELKPQYDRWEQGPKELSPTGAVDEAAPAINPGAKNNIPPGSNKPQAQLWTSTAFKTKDGTWTSDWGRWIANNHKAWLAPKGYLYKVKPGALVLSLDSDYQAERLYQAYESLGMAKSLDHSVYRMNLSGVFPWDQVNKHFDAVHHDGIGYGNDFLYGWDVESTAWFDTNHLTLIGEVPITQWDDEQ